MPSGRSDHTPPRRRRLPAVEGLEHRTLLSTLGTPARARAAAALGPVTAAGSVSAAQVGVDPGDLGPPTPQEAAKQRFVARLAGTFETAPGRYALQPLQGVVLSTGGSNQSLRLQSQMQFFTYTDPNSPPNGQINLAAKNVGNTGNQLVLDLTADPNSLSHGMPTRFTWTVNSVSGGVWQNATGQGTLEIHYNLSGPARGVRMKGSVTLQVLGQIVSNHGLTLNTALPGSRTTNQQPAPVPERKG